MAQVYRVYLTANIEIGGEFEADSWDEAVEAARQELRAQGEISNVCTTVRGAPPYSAMSCEDE